MFVQSEKFVEAHGGKRTDISIFGQESNPTTWRLAHMNLAIRGIEANLGPQPADTFLRDLHPDLKADFILANPPFNVSDWSGATAARRPPLGIRRSARRQRQLRLDSALHPPPAAAQRPRRRRGRLRHGQRLARPATPVAKAKSAARSSRPTWSTASSPCPPQLFFTTGIPVCLWFLTRDKTGKNIRRGTPQPARGRQGETLFIDARKLGTMQTRVLRVLTGIEDAECPRHERPAARPATSAASSTPSANGAANRRRTGGTRRSTANGRSPRRRVLQSRRDGGDRKARPSS